MQGSHSPGIVKFPKISITLCGTPSHVTHLHMHVQILSVLSVQYINVSTYSVTNIYNDLISCKILKTGNARPVSVPPVTCVTANSS